MVRHALQLPKLMATLHSTTNAKIYFFILFRFLVDIINDLLFAEGGHKHTPFAVFGLGARVDADAGTTGNVS